MHPPYPLEYIYINVQEANISYALMNHSDDGGGGAEKFPPPPPPPPPTSRFTN